MGAILESINENGFYGSIVAQRSTGFILAGNHRYQAAVQAGASEVPVTWVDVDDARALRILLADNRTTRLGHDNEQALAELLKELADDGGLAGTGYDGDDLDQLLRDLEGPTVLSDEEAFGKLPDGDREPYRQMTFTVHDSQHEQVERALKLAHKQGEYDESVNANSNGNALARICETYLTVIGDGG